MQSIYCHFYLDGNSPQTRTSAEYKKGSQLKLSVEYPLLVALEYW